MPTFIVEGESGPRLFFGQDRLIFVEEALRSHPLMRDEGSTRPPACGSADSDWRVRRPSRQSGTQADVCI